MTSGGETSRLSCTLHNFINGSELTTFAECFGFYKVLNGSNTSTDSGETNADTSAGYIEPFWLTSYPTGVNIQLISWSSSSEQYAGSFFAKPAAITRGALTHNLNSIENQCEVSLQGLYGSHKILMKAMNNNYRVVILWQNPQYADDNQILTIGEGTPTLFNGSSASITVRSDCRILDRMIPDICIQRTCNNILFDRRCGLSYENYAIVTTWGELSPSVQTQSYFATILSSDSLNTGYSDYWSNGQVIIGDWDTSRERRAITSSSNGTIMFSPSFDRTIGNNETVIITPGCTKNIEYCKSRFNNMNNFMGFPELPYKNPAIMGFL
jgi:hypothetical protein